MYTLVICISAERLYFVLLAFHFTQPYFVWKCPNPCSKLMRMLTVCYPGRYTAPRSPQEHDTAGLLKEMQAPATSHPDPFLDDSAPINTSGSRYQATAKRSGPPRGIFDDIWSQFVWADWGWESMSPFHYKFFLWDIINVLICVVLSENLLWKLFKHGCICIYLRPTIRSKVSSFTLPSVDVVQKK